MYIVFGTKTVFFIIQFRSFHTSMNFYSVKWKEKSLIKQACAVQYLQTTLIAVFSNLDTILIQMLCDSKGPWPQLVTAPVLSPLWAFFPTPA